MKKLLFMGVLFLSASSFANDKCEEEKEIVEKEDVVAMCCTATLKYYDFVFDQVTVCGGPDPCGTAKGILLNRHQNTGLE